MFLLEIAILSLIIGLIRKGSVKNFFTGGLRGWYIFLVSILLFISQKVLSIAGVTALNDFAFWIIIAAYILLFVGLFLNLDGIWVYILLIGALLNFVIIVLNGGLMPVSESALNIAGLGGASGAYMTRFASTMSVANDSTIFLWKYLGAIIPLPLPSILGEVLTPGTIVMAIGSFGLIQSIMTTEYMDEEEYEKYMQELSSGDKQDAPLLDNSFDDKDDTQIDKKAYDEPSKEDFDFAQNDENNAFLDEAKEDNDFDFEQDLQPEEDEEVDQNNNEEEVDYFADLDLEDLNDNDEQEDEKSEESADIEEEGMKLEDEDLLKELEDEFNQDEEELFNNDEDLDDLLDKALSEDELEDENEDEIQEEEPIEEENDDETLELEEEIETNNQNIEDLLEEALGDDESDEEIEELLNELRNLSIEDDQLPKETLDIKDEDFENIEEIEIEEEPEEEIKEEDIDYDFFKDDDDNEVEEVTSLDLAQTQEYTPEDNSQLLEKDEDDDIEEIKDDIDIPTSNIKDAKELLNKVGKPRQEQIVDPISAMPDVDVDSPFIITEGRIVENPYYKFKKGTQSRREEAISSPEIADNGIYVMSGGGLAKVEDGKVQPKVQKEEKKQPVRRSNIPNMTSTPSFDNDEKEQNEQFTPITKTLESEERKNSKKINQQVKNPVPQMPMENPYDHTKEQEESNRPRRKFKRVYSEKLEREPNMTIINDSSTGRTIKRETSNQPREEIIPTYKEVIKDEQGHEVPNPYEKVEMKIGDVEIKFWKKDNQ